MSNQSRQNLQLNDFFMAIQEVGTIIDVSVDDLMQLHQKAEKFARLRNNNKVVAEKIPDDYAMALEEMNTFIDVTMEDLIQLNQKAEKYARMRDKESILVEKLMTHPVKTIQPDCSFSDAVHLLVTNKISGLPVVDEKNKLIGIITEADFLSAIGVPLHQPSHSVWQTLENIFSNPPKVYEPYALVSDLMVKNVISITPQQTLHDVLNAMKKNQIKRLVVCDKSKHVVGIVTRSDLVRLFFDYFQELQPCKQ